MSDAMVIARAVDDAANDYDEGGYLGFDYDAASAVIAAALQAAVDAERERCAKVGDEMVQRLYTYACVENLKVARADGPEAYTASPWYALANALEQCFPAAIRALGGGDEELRTEGESARKFRPE